MPVPIFISFEGCEGSGKSTQTKLLYDRMWSSDIQADLVREPGTTPLGHHLRDYLKSKKPLQKEAELLLFEAARAELVLTRVLPSLRNGFNVIADRFEASSIAYQGYGKGIDLEVIKKINKYATQDVEPDVTFFLDIDPAEGLRRVGEPQLGLAFEASESDEAGREDIAGHRRFEDEPIDFHERVRKGFLDLAWESPKRWLVIDASLSAEHISQEIWHHVLMRMESPYRNWAKVQPLL